MYFEYRDNCNGVTICDCLIPKRR